MFSLNFFTFTRRIASLKVPRFSLCTSMCTGSEAGYYGCSRNSTYRFLRNSASINIHQYHCTDINKFKIVQRYKQTASDQGKKYEDISPNEEPPEKLSLFKRYRKMLKEYWYVLLPVHFVTSAFWFGGFYYAAKCGIDIVPFLEYINLPEKYIEPLRKSSLGYIAVASAFYKLATPARYMVTLGGTTVAVKFLTKRGLIRPAPTKAELKNIIQNKLKKETSEKQL